REARDLHGVTFAGHSPHRPLVHHPADLAAWTTPVHGEDVHQVAVGPIHAGVIESGHFRFHLVGERILKLDPRLFHKHRGLERAAEGRTPFQARAVVQRACAACAVTNGVAYAQAVEQALGLWPDDDLRRMRTLLLELERLYNHLNDIGAVCAGVGLAAGLVGAGGAFLLVPLLLVAVGVPIRVTIGSSLAITALASTAGVTGKVITAQLPLWPTLAVLLGAVPGARLGAAVSRRLRARALKMILFVVVLATALRVWCDVLTRR
ncbi:MAG TPA: TSUP family transporter, partial [Methylomirabilota bacterium]|nr:TSUP family transporter [Methylomirabilota bacterium]